MFDYRSRNRYEQLLIFGPAPPAHDRRCEGDLQGSLCGDAGNDRLQMKEPPDRVHGFCGSASLREIFA
jgi:hypothetical protein